MNPFQKKDAKVGAGTITYYEAGSGHPLVFLHSGGGIRFGLMLNLLAEKFRTIVPVMPGYDGTETVPGVDTIQTLGKFIGDFIATVSAEPVDLVGHSIGGHVATWCTVQCPAQVGQLALIGTGGFRPPHLGPMKFPSDPVERTRMMTAHPERMIPERRTPEVAKRDFEMNMFYSKARFYDEELVGRLNEIQCLTLLVHGTAEGAVPVESVWLLKEKIPRSHLIYLYDAAHNVDTDQPERLARLLTDFASRGEGFIVNWGKAA